MRCKPENSFVLKIFRVRFGSARYSLIKPGNGLKAVDYLNSAKGELNHSTDKFWTTVVSGNVLWRRLHLQKKSYAVAITWINRFVVEVTNFTTKHILRVFNPSFRDLFSASNKKMLVSPDYGAVLDAERWKLTSRSSLQFYVQLRHLGLSFRRGCTCYPKCQPRQTFPKLQLIKGTMWYGNCKQITKVCLKVAIAGGPQLIASQMLQNSLIVCVLLPVLVIAQCGPGAVYDSDRNK